uniref:Uncharacterized protein n=1 Tax=Timema cristinae TaxID=61476 RepID=A0A7R9D5N7_TIMCR|nr:unnamed protein product [Timema cristinae]
MGLKASLATILSSCRGSHEIDTTAKHKWIKKEATHETDTTKPKRKKENNETDTTEPKRVRYPEELSLCKPLEPNHLKYNLKDLPGNKKRQQQHQNHGGRGGPNNGVSPPDTNTFIPNHSPSGSTGSLEQSPQPFMCAPVTPTRHQTSTPISSPVGSGTWKKNNQSYGEMNGSYSPYNVNNSLTLEMLNGSLDSSLANSPSQPSPEARNKLLRPRTLVERARINVA